MPITKMRIIRDKGISTLLILSVTGALVMLGYTIAKPPVKEKFTEFYILGLEGQAVDYPESIVVGEVECVVVGIINREQETMTYRVEVIVDGSRSNEVGPLTLEQKQKWEQEVCFQAMRAGERQKVEFVLYSNEEPYRLLHLWVNVGEKD